MTYLHGRAQSNCRYWRAMASSIACTRSFDYERLLDEADFGGRRGAKRARTLFTRAETADFETVVRRLEESADTAALYPNADRSRSSDGP